MAQKQGIMSDAQTNHDVEIAAVRGKRLGPVSYTHLGNFIADLHLGAGFDIQDVYSKLTGMLGVLEHGLFLNMCKRMIVGHSNGEVQVIENPSK